MIRRTFLRVLGITATSVAIAQYTEPLKLLSKEGDWIEDHDDFFIVRIPDYKMFARETLNKPTIFVLGELATVSGVMVSGYVNFYTPRGGLISGSCFDGSQMKTLNDRAVLFLQGRDVVIEGVSIFGSDGLPSGLQIAEYSTLQGLRLRQDTYGTWYEPTEQEPA